MIGLSGSALLSDYSYLSAGKVVDARTAGYSVSLDYSFKPARWELSLAGRNLVGTSQYERVHISSAVQSYTLTYLRPREVVVRFCLDL